MSDETPAEQRAWEFYGQELGYGPEHLEGRLGRERIAALERFFESARQQGRREGIEEAAKKLFLFRHCDCNSRPGVSAREVGQEHWGSCIERLYQEIRALLPPEPAE